MARFLNIAFWTFGGVAIVASMFSMSCIAGDHPEAWFRNLWLAVSRGPSASREVFTASGWRARKVALASGALAVLTILAHAFVG